MTLSHMYSERSGPGMWPQPEILPGDQRSQPPLARSYPAASVIYCQLCPDDRLDFSPGDEQLEWWHDFCQKTQAVLKPYGAVPIERDGWSICCALGLRASTEKALGAGLRPVQCALQLLSCVGQMELPGGASLRAKIGVHSGEASDSLVGCSNTLHYRLCGPAYDVARQLADHASWGDMLVSEGVWREQGQHRRLWVYNQGVSMPWGPIVSCYALQPEGQAAYLHSHALPTLVTRGLGMPIMPCHSTVWQVEGASKASAAGHLSSRTPLQLHQSLQRQPLAAEPLNPFAVNSASYQFEAEESGIGQLHPGTVMSQPAMRAAGGYSPLDSVASSTYGMRLPNAQSKGCGRPFDAWSSQHSQFAPPAHSSVWGTDSAEAFPEFVHADLLGLSPGSRHSLDTMEESLDSASALQPHAPTFAHLLQQQNERAARHRAAQGSPGTSGTVGRLSASQMAYALSALPKLSDTERMSRFMAALQESRPRASHAPAASDKPPVLPSSRSKQLLHGLSELWGTPNAGQAVHAPSGTSQASGSGSSRCTSLREGSSLPTLGANPSPHPWPEQFIVEGNWFSQQQQQQKPEQAPEMLELNSAAQGTGWGPERNPWPQMWGSGKPGMAPPEPSNSENSEAKEAPHGATMQRQQTWIGVTVPGGMISSVAAEEPAAEPPAHWALSLAPLRLSDVGEFRPSTAGIPSAQELSAQPTLRSVDSAWRSGSGAASQLPGMQSALRSPWPEACKWHPSQQRTDATPQLQGLPQQALKSGPSLAVPQAPCSAAPAAAMLDPAGAFEVYWGHVKNYRSDVPQPVTRSMYWDHVQATNGLLQSGTQSKAAEQKPSHAGCTPAASAIQGSSQHMQAPTQQRELPRMAASVQPQDSSTPESSATSELHCELTQRQSSRNSSAQSGRNKMPWSQQPPIVALPPLQAYEPDQVAQAQGAACSAGAPIASLTAAQQLSAHDGIRRSWAPGGTMRVTWQEDPSFVPTDGRMSSSATSLSSYRNAARSILGGTAVEAFPPAAGAQLPVSRQLVPAARMTAPSVPASSMSLPATSAASTPPSSAAHAQGVQRPRLDLDIGRSRLEPVRRSPVPRKHKQTDAPLTVWVRLACAFWAQLLCSPGRVTSLRLPSGKIVRQSATLEFMKPRLERRFQKSWATGKLAHDKAVLIFFILLLLGIEVADIAFGAAPQVHHILPNLGAAAVMGATLAAMVLRPAWYISHRAGLQLLLRVLRAVSLNWQVKQTALVLLAASAALSPARTFLSIIVKSGFPLAVLSLCDGNTMGPHIVGDLVCVLLAAAQAPWLCSMPRSLLMSACSIAWLAARAALLIVLCSAVLFSMEEAARRAFIKALDRGEKPDSALPGPSSEVLPNPAKLYVTSSGTLRCGSHALNSGS